VTHPRRASHILRGKRAAVLLFSYYPADVRPRRAAEALVAEGMHVELICLRKSTKEPRRETFNGVDIFRLPLRRHRGGAVTYLFRYSAFILSAFLLLALRSMTRRFALVHVHNMPDLLVFGALVPKLLGAKIMLDLHDPMPELMMTIFRLDARSFPVRLLKRLGRAIASLRPAPMNTEVPARSGRIFGSKGTIGLKSTAARSSPGTRSSTLAAMLAPLENPTATMPPRSSR